MTLESVINISSANIKYGFGATKEVGFDMKELGANRVMVVTAQNLVEKEPAKTTMCSYFGVLYTDLEKEAQENYGLT